MILSALSHKLALLREAKPLHTANPSSFMHEPTTPRLMDTLRCNAPYSLRPSYKCVYLEYIAYTGINSVQGLAIKVVRITFNLANLFSSLFSINPLLRS